MKSVKKIVITNTDDNNWYKVDQEYSIYHEDETRYFNDPIDRGYWIDKKHAQEIIKELNYEIC